MPTLYQAWALIPPPHPKLLITVSTLQPMQTIFGEARYHTLQHSTSSESRIGKRNQKLIRSTCGITRLKVVVLGGQTKAGAAWTLTELRLGGRCRQVNLRRWVNSGYHILSERLFIQWVLFVGYTGNLFHWVSVTRPILFTIQVIPFPRTYDSVDQSITSISVLLPTLFCFVFSCAGSYFFKCALFCRPL